MKRPFRQRLATAIDVNRLFLHACLCGWLAWLFWPESIEWWGFAVASILLGLGALHSVIAALRAMVLAYEHDRAVAEFEALGTAPRSARMASDDDLRKAEMIDG